LSKILNTNIGKKITSELEQGLLVSIKFRIVKMLDGIVDGALSDNDELKKRVEKIAEKTEPYKAIQEALNNARNT
jgi:hypothetical protein